MVETGCITGLLRGIERYAAAQKSQRWAARNPVRRIEHDLLFHPFTVSSPDVLVFDDIVVGVQTYWPMPVATAELSDAVAL